ncbi:hypothetical protein [Luteimonas vadosa]
MTRVLKTFADRRLARKIAVLRTASAALALLVLATVAMMAARGELIVRGSHAGGRFVSDGVLKMVSWSDSPLVYVIATIAYLAMGLLLVACMHAVAGKLIENFHGRPLFRRKYPY